MDHETLTGRKGGGGGKRLMIWRKGDRCVRELESRCTEGGYKEEKTNAIGI
jgi:hypothetical protein